ncbi:2-hydroxyacid dehydrogenase [Segetibacter sp. 3557_3]|uniref:2-hydroxyacid dehydrogenase n=1 Tax=Segetibacter sp. 3557_3 TaxID=2547429 RepID=UPI001058AF11|nr:2-hydroxyacid dehydrogenase [Segetibacter sp. 3557_3]TDH26082.1 2-hydroxyacid dehydrogenase [Segetibacter sp. 3557_3]
MKIAFFSTQPYDKLFFQAHNATFDMELQFFTEPLSAETTGLAQGSDAVCVFVNDKLNAAVIEKLSAIGIRVIALRCAGFNNVDLVAAKQMGLRVCRVPSYSPEAVAEHAVAMILTLNRKTHKAYNRVREQNFSIDGLLGFDIRGKTVGVIGTGNIGRSFCKIMTGFGAEVIAFDLIASRDVEALGVKYLPLVDILDQADIISLHCPLNEQTRHIINDETISMMKDGVMIINTSRGGLVDTRAAIKALKTKKIGYLGIDVYEQEEKLFFHDLSTNIIDDDVISRLMSFPNVLVTAHQGFFTREALDEIAATTLQNVQNLLLSNNLVAQSTLLA